MNNKKKDKVMEIKGKGERGNIKKGCITYQFSLSTSRETFRCPLR